MPTLRSEAYDAYNDALQAWVDCKLVLEEAKVSEEAKAIEEATTSLHYADIHADDALGQLSSVTRNDYLTNMAKP